MTKNKLIYSKYKSIMSYLIILNFLFSCVEHGALTQVGKWRGAKENLTPITKDFEKKVYNKGPTPFVRGPVIKDCFRNLARV